MLSARTFGVEIECGHNTLTCHEISQRMTDAGFPMYIYGVHTTGERRKRYGYGSDGSGIEIKTPVLKGEKGYRELIKAMEFLSDLGCWVTQNDGMHVHIGAAGFEDDEVACATLARSYYNNQNVIGRMVSAHRTGWVSSRLLEENEVGKLGQKLTPHDRTRGYDGQKYWGNRRAINFAAIREHGTVEFRLHEGCLSADKAVAWVKFCQKFVDHAAQERKPLTCAKNKRVLLTTLGVPQDATAILSRKQISNLPERRRGPVRY